MSTYTKQQEQAPHRAAAVLFLLLALGFISQLQASFANVYISQSGAGAQTGADCTTAKPVTFFNSGANWGAGAAQIGPDTVVHLCGTFTGGSNSTILTFQGSGTSGHKITLLWETGAIVQAPYFAFAGGIIADGRSFITIDGGTNGILQNTANGTNLANHIDSSVGIHATNCSNCEIKNLTIANIYVHVGPGDGGLEHSQLNAVSWSGSHWKIHDMVIHDCGWCLKNFWQNGDTDVEVGPNVEVFNMDHGGTTAGTSGNATLFTMHDNHFHDMVSWDTSGGGYHHDGWHIFQAGSGQITGMKIYNNLFDGNPGSVLTAQCVYAERQDAAVASVGLQIFNNICDGRLQPGANFGMITIGDLQNTLVANNTLLGVNHDSSACFILSAGTTTIENNICSGSWVGTWFPYNNAPSKVYKFNTYAAVGACGFGYDTSAVCHTTIANWQAFSGQDANSQSVASANLDSTFHPNTGSPVINAGTNLTSSGIAALNVDKAGVARPATGPWTAGAFTAGGTGGTPVITVTPNSHNYGTIPLNSTSGPFSYVVTNTGTATLNITTAAISGTNPTDFVIASNNCNGISLPPNSGSCTVSITFTANLVPAGAESAVLQVSGNSAPGTATLTGTGQAPATAVMTITPNPVNFSPPNYNVGSSSPDITLTFKNNGNADFQFVNTVAFIAVSNLNFARTGSVCAQNGILHPTEQCTATFKFQPSSAGALSATVTANGNVTGTTTLNGTGVNPGSPLITVTPTSHDYGSVPRGTQSSTFNFTIANSGTAPAILGPQFFTISGGTNPADFQRVSPGGADCSGGQTLNPGNNCLLSTAFFPTTGGAETATLTINSNAPGPAPTAALSGTGTAPALTINNGAPIAFGNQNVGSPSTGIIVPIKNTGNATETFTGTPVTLVGANPGDYSLSAIDCSGTLTAGSTCHATVTFTPTTSGARPATLNVNGTVNGSQGITGTGLATSAVIVISPRPVPFPNTVIGGTPSAVVVTISNTGNATQASLSYTITTGDSGDFTRTSTTCGASIPASSSCTMTFSFLPTGLPRPETTLLTITGTVQATAQMNGTGVASGPGGGPAPWMLTFSNNYQTITATGKGFTSKNQITINGTAVPTTCTPTVCTATIPSSPVWLPFIGKSLVVGFQ